MRSIEAIIERQALRWEFQRELAEKTRDETPKIRPVITVSRALGANGEETAKRLAEVSRFQLFDREILDTIANDFGIQQRMVEMLDEKSQSELESWFLGMMRGRIIDQSDYIISLTKMVGSLVRFGDAILVGRGTNIIIGPKKGFHLRITGSQAQRMAALSKRMGITPDKAKQLVEKSDLERAHFIKKSFGADINDPSLYDITINTDFLTVDDVVDIAFMAYIKKEKGLREGK